MLDQTRAVECHQQLTRRWHSALFSMRSKEKSEKPGLKRIRQIEEDWCWQF